MFQLIAGIMVSFSLITTPAFADQKKTTPKKTTPKKRDDMGCGKWADEKKQICKEKPSCPEGMAPTQCDCKGNYGKGCWTCAV